jgi:hypothetical protein
MEGSPFLPLPEGMLIDRVEQTDSQLTVTVISTRAEGACPGCGCPSKHVHSRLRRKAKRRPLDFDITSDFILHGIRMNWEE